MNDDVAGKPRVETQRVYSLSFAAIKHCSIRQAGEDRLNDANIQLCREEIFAAFQL